MESPETRQERHTAKVNCRDHMRPEIVYVDTGILVRNKDDDKDNDFVFKCTDEDGNGHYTSMHASKENAEELAKLGAKEMVVDKTLPSDHPLVIGDLHDLSPIGEAEIDALAQMPIEEFNHKIATELSS